MYGLWNLTLQNLQITLQSMYLVINFDLQLVVTVPLEGQKPV